MKYLHLIVLSLFIFGCSQETETEEIKDAETEDATPIETEEDLIEVKGHTFTQYYPGKKKIKFKGMQDDEQRRDGLWTFYSEEGKELSTTMFKHGMKHGHMIVKHPNGAIYYYGEMHEDVKVGIWKTYDENGELVSETDFGSKK